MYIAVPVMPIGPKAREQEHCWREQLMVIVIAGVLLLYAILSTKDAALPIQHFISYFSLQVAPNHCSSWYTGTTLS